RESRSAEANARRRSSASTATHGSAVKPAAHTSVGCDRRSCWSACPLNRCRACSAVGDPGLLLGRSQKRHYAGRARRTDSPPVLVLSKQVSDIRESHPVDCHILTSSNRGSILTRQ